MAREVLEAAGGGERPRCWRSTCPIARAGSPRCSRRSSRRAASSTCTRGRRASAVRDPALPPRGPGPRREAPRGGGREARRLGRALRPRELLGAARADARARERIFDPAETLPSPSAARCRRAASPTVRRALGVPFYRDALGRAGVSAEAIRSVDDVRRPLHHEGRPPPELSARPPRRAARRAGPDPRLLRHHREAHLRPTRAPTSTPGPASSRASSSRAGSGPSTSSTSRSATGSSPAASASTTASSGSAPRSSRPPAGTRRAR